MIVTADLMITDTANQQAWLITYAERRFSRYGSPGLAGDICVYITALYSMKEGFETFILEKGTQPLSQQDFNVARQTLTAKGGRLISMSQINYTVNGVN